VISARMMLEVIWVPGQPAVRAYSGPVELDCGVVCSVPPGRVFSEVQIPFPRSFSIPHAQPWSTMRVIAASDTVSAAATATAAPRASLRIAPTAEQ
jgi:hypothetical protein